MIRRAISFDVSVRRPSLIQARTRGKNYHSKKKIRLRKISRMLEVSKRLLYGRQAGLDAALDLQGSFRRQVVAAAQRPVASSDTTIVIWVMSARLVVVRGKLRSNDDRL